MTAPWPTSKWMNSGKPTRCARCSENFQGSAYRGENGKYYCSPECREWDEGTVEERARRLQ